MKIGAAIAGALLIAAGPLEARRFCDDLSRLLDAAAKPLDADTPSLVLPTTDLPPAECSTSRALDGGKTVFCAWPFDYRSELSVTTFATLVDAVTGCAGTGAEVVRDQAVNHPDTYDLRVMMLDEAEIGVSLKDKAAFGQSYVFLRVQADAPR